MVEFEPVEGLKGVYSLHKGNLRSIAVQLANDSYCVISPIASIPAAAYEPLGPRSAIRFVLAPNHYHNKGLADFSNNFPKAKILASELARKRLKDQTGLKFGELSALAALLQKKHTLLEPKGLKTGEIWLRHKTPNLTAWVVTDAFCGPKMDKGAAEAAKPELLKTFPNFGVADKSAYCEWVQAQLEADKPQLLIPCHGKTLRSAKLTASLAALIRKLGK